MEALEFLEGSDDLIEGLAIPFAGPNAGKDLDGEDFGPDTDFALDWFPQGRPVIYHHGKNSDLGPSVQGRQVEHELRAEGIWAKAELDKSARYHQAVSRMVREGRLYFSSGSMPHLVKASKDGHIERWPWVELSLTPTPANPTAVVYAAKSVDLYEHLAAADLAVPAQLIVEALKALESTNPESSLDPAGIVDRAGRVSAAVVDLRDHARGSAEMRAKAGRALSAANRERITAALATREAVLAAYSDLEALLTETDPDGKSAPDDIAGAVLATLARSGVATTPSI